MLHGTPVTTWVWKDAEPQQKLPVLKSGKWMRITTTRSPCTVMMHRTRSSSPCTSRVKQRVTHWTMRGLEKSGINKARAVNVFNWSFWGSVLLVLVTAVGLLRRWILFCEFVGSLVMLWFIGLSCNKGVDLVHGKT